MRPAPFLMPLLLLIATPTRAADEVSGRDFRETLLALDQQFWDASARGDVEAIGRLIADDYVGIDQDQHRWGRADLLAHLRATRTSGFERTTDPQTARLTDRSAVLTYEGRYKVHDGQQVIDSGPLRMSACWVLRNGGWFVVFSEVSKVAGGHPTASSKGEALPASGQRDGLKYVASLHNLSKTKFAVRQAIWFDLKVHNPTDHVVEGVFSAQQAFYAPPVVRDAHGKPVQVLPPTAIFAGIWALIPYRLAPRETKQVGRASLVFDPDAVVDDSPAHPRVQCVARAGSGTYQVAYPDAAAIEVEIR